MVFLSSTAGREEEIEALWKECFPEDGGAYLDWLMARKYDPGLCRALEADGEITALLHLLPLKLRLSGKEVPLPFVYGAGTLIKHRNRGLMRELLKKTFEEERSNGACCIALYPFQYGFYRKAGFGLLDECASCRFKTDELIRESSVWATAGTEASDLTPDDMLSVWKTTINRFDVGPIRDRTRCALRLDEWQCDGGSAVCCRIGKEAAGYALFAPLDGCLTVEEILYGCGDALSSLLAILAKAAAATSCAFIKLELPASEFPHHLFSDSRNTAFLEPHAMFRVLDVPALLTGLETPAEGSFCLGVSDGLCGWNDGAFTVLCAHGRMTAVCGGTPDAWCGAGVLSTLAAGAMDGKTAAALGLLKTDNPAAVRAFERRKGFFLEHY